MNEHVTLELDSRQRDLVLEGLRYIRSARRFEFRETNDPQADRRERDLKAIAHLMGRLEAAAARATVEA